MTEVTWVVLIVLALIIAAGAAWYFLQRRRSNHLRQRFGPEYENSLRKQGNRRWAEKELARREERVEHLHLRPLPSDDRDRFAEQWRSVQGRFVDDPRSAIAEGDRLVTEAMRARGYPISDFEQRAADISVDHPQVVEHYRSAYQIARRADQGEASTEELRQAMVHYRGLFQELLDSEADTQPEIRR